MDNLRKGFMNLSGIGSEPDFSTTGEFEKAVVSNGWAVYDNEVVAEFFGDYEALLRKASSMPISDEERDSLEKATRDLSGLTKKTVTDKNGKVTTKWVRAVQDVAKDHPDKKDEGHSEAWERHQHNTKVQRMGKEASFAHIERTYGKEASDHVRTKHTAVATGKTEDKPEEKPASEPKDDGDFTHSHSSNGVMSYKHKSGAIVTVGGSNSDVIEHAGKGLGIMTMAKVGSGHTLQSKEMFHYKEEGVDPRLHVSSPSYMTPAESKSVAQDFLKYEQSLIKIDESNKVGDIGSKLNKYVDDRFSGTYYSDSDIKRLGELTDAEKDVVIKKYEDKIKSASGKDLTELYTKIASDVLKKVESDHSNIVRKYLRKEYANAFPVGSEIVYRKGKTGIVTANDGKGSTFQVKAGSKEIEVQYATAVDNASIAKEGGYKANMDTLMNRAYDAFKKERFGNSGASAGEPKKVEKTTPFGKVEIVRTGEGTHDWHVELDGSKIMSGWKNYIPDVAESYIDDKHVKEFTIYNYARNQWAKDKKNFNLLDEKTHNYDNYILIKPDGKLKHVDYATPRWVRHPDEYGTEAKADQWEDWAENLDKLVKYINKNNK